MDTMINAVDLKDPNDSQGRTYRQINNAKSHKYGLGVLIELENGVRLFTAKQTRDCDGTPLYSLTTESQKSPDNPLNEIYWVHGYGEDGMVKVKKDNPNVIGYLITDDDEGVHEAENNQSLEQTQILRNRLANENSSTGFTIIAELDV